MGPLQSTISALSITLVATADVRAFRFVTVNAAEAGAGEAAIGVAKNDEKAGRAFAVDVVGVFDMVAGAAITAGDQVEADADALPIPRTSGVVNGLALTSAANPGDLVKILIK